LAPYSHPLWGQWQIVGSNKTTQRDFENPGTGYLFGRLVEPNGSYFGGIRPATSGAYYPMTYKINEDSIFFDPNSFLAEGAKGVFSIKSDTLHLFFSWPGADPFDEKLIRQR